MAKNVPSSFHALKLNIGDSFSLEALTAKARFPVKLIGYSEGNSIIVSVPKVNGKEFLLKNDTILKVRLIADNFACGFQTKVLTHYTAPFLHIHLEYPDKLEAIPVRSASRVRLSLPVSIEEAESGALYGEWPREEILVDVSNSGARIQCKEGLAPVGSDLLLSFSVSVDGIKRDLKLPATVRNIAEVSDPVAGEVFQYGVQFKPINNDDRVYICGYVYEQMLYHTEKSKVTFSK